MFKRHLLVRHHRNTIVCCKRMCSESTVIIRSASYIAHSTHLSPYLCTGALRTACIRISAHRFRNSYAIRPLKTEVQKRGVQERLYLVDFRLVFSVRSIQTKIFIVWTSSSSGRLHISASREVQWAWRRLKSTFRKESRNSGGV